jgi:hypothetical protein
MKKSTKTRNGRKASTAAAAALPPKGNPNRQGVNPPKSAPSPVNVTIDAAFGGNPGGNGRKGGVNPPSAEEEARYAQNLAARLKNKNPKKYVYRTGEQVLEEVRRKFGPLWLAGANGTVFIGDAEYYCPPLDEAAKIVRDAGLHKEPYALEIFDCDDYAMVLKGHFARKARSNGENKPFAFACGIVWLGQPFPHALNWVLSWSSGKREACTIYLVEPQTGAFYDIDGEGRLRKVDTNTGKIGRAKWLPYRDIYFVTI